MKIFFVFLLWGITLFSLEAVEVFCDGALSTTKDYSLEGSKLTNEKMVLVVSSVLSVFCPVKFKCSLSVNRGNGFISYDHCTTLFGAPLPGGVAMLKKMKFGQGRFASRFFYPLVNNYTSKGFCGKETVSEIAFKF